MTDDQVHQLSVEVRRIRELLELLAEPAIAQRDAKLRDELRKIAGISTKKQQSVLLMDGRRTQKEIVSQVSIDQGDLSKMVGKLESGGLLSDGKKHPKLAIAIPSNFFEANAGTK